MSWSEITVIKTGNIIVFQVVIWPVQLNPVNENPHNKEANFPAML
ncbi:putative transposase [Escherichia coli P0299917.5]|nr:putative transposase [Escherichia coli P0299917.5]